MSDGDVSEVRRRFVARISAYKYLIVVVAIFALIVTAVVFFRPTGPSLEQQCTKKCQGLGKFSRFYQDTSGPLSAHGTKHTFNPEWKCECY